MELNLTMSMKEIENMVRTHLSLSEDVKVNVNILKEGKFSSICEERTRIMQKWLHFYNTKKTPVVYLIKDVRELSGLPLRESKEVVDDLREVISVEEANNILEHNRVNVDSFWNFITKKVQ